MVNNGVYGILFCIGKLLNDEFENYTGEYLGKVGSGGQKKITI